MPCKIFSESCNVFLKDKQPCMRHILVLAFALAFTAGVSAQSDQFTVYVEGLTCPVCAGGLESKFKTLKGISNVKADFKTGKLTFEIAPRQKLQFAAVNALVEKAGYKPKGAMVRRADGRMEKWGELKPIAPPASLSPG